MNSISTDDWETKKPSIVRLYRDHNWTVREVLNEVRTHSFDPSEGQLRHRLKKWGVTKATRLSRRYNWRENLDRQLPGRQALVALETVRPTLGAEPMAHLQNDPTTCALNMMQYTPSGLLSCNADTDHVAINPTANPGWYYVYRSVGTQTQGPTMQHTRYTCPRHSAFVIEPDDQVAQENAAIPAYTGDELNL
ncbi:hypothetical protein BDV33DRAFT_186201 [Aspergillus novoparasiticus]|uniref:Clr5 domain-containing protein n=1 Tax=Aspergillus novoparasiticus TaxID=986946 RepID=A0A5N6E8N7_9EURO|nr:hypothetical protein BDV33DRAFT_186201 [Aspergillus novoparasiticus]